LAEPFTVATRLGTRSKRRWSADSRSAHTADQARERNRHDGLRHQVACRLLLGADRGRVRRRASPRWSAWRTACAGAHGVRSR
jgi:hypothetical protein